MSETSQEFLTRYAEKRDAQAFRELVDRHQDMVYAACRRILKNGADAEDVAQTCFLKLARKPEGVRGSVAGWLHRSATNAAIDLARQAKARKAREALAMELKPTDESSSWRQVSDAVDEAINQLPDELRIPVVRYYLERANQQQIARELGVTHSAISKRLQRGIEDLRGRLTKAGIAVSAAILGALILENAAEAAPASLAAALGKMAIAGAAKGAAAGVASIGAKTLAGGIVVKTSVALGIVVALTAGGVVAHKLLGQAEPAVAPVADSATPAATSHPENPPAPWQDGEEMTLRLITQAGAEIGALFYRASAVSHENAPAWRIECQQVIPINNYLQYARVDADAASFAPIFGRTKNSLLGDFRAVYKPDGVELTSVQQGKDTKRTIPVARPVYDNEQVLYFLRGLPLTEGYDATFAIFPVAGGAVVDCSIKVVARERVTAPAGEFDCFKTELKVLAQGVVALSHTLWFSADEKKLLVKYDAVNAVMELAKVSVVDAAQPAVFEDPVTGIHLAAPPGWHFYQGAIRGNYKASVQMLPPEQIAWAVFMANDLPGPGAGARQIAEKDAETVANFFAEYLVQPESWTDLTVAGMPAASYVADYHDKGVAMTEYRTYILGEGGVYWAVFRIEKELFQANRESFDKVVAGFELRLESGAAADLNNPRVVVELWLAAVVEGDGARAQELSRPGEWTDSAFETLGEAVALSDAKIEKAWSNGQDACAVTNWLPLKIRPGRCALGLGLRMINGKWLVRDLDFLPDQNALDDYLADYKRAAPTAVEISPGQNAARPAPTLAMKMSEGIAGAGTIRTALRVYAATHGGEYPTLDAESDWMATLGFRPDDLRGRFFGPENYTVSLTPRGYTITARLGDETYTIDQDGRETGTFRTAP